ncbi:MAG: hypothetical protein AAGA60_29250 [Cyanobacteria bacterium P01_E01_bin.42]
MNEPLKGLGIGLTGTAEQLKAAIAKFWVIIPELKDETREWHEDTRNPTDPPTYRTYFRVYSWRNRLTVYDELAAAQAETRNAWQHIADLEDALERERERYKQLHEKYIQLIAPQSAVLSPNCKKHE